MNDQRIIKNLPAGVTSIENSVDLFRFLYHECGFAKKYSFNVAEKSKIKAATKMLVKEGEKCTVIKLAGDSYCHIFAKR